MVSGFWNRTSDSQLEAELKRATDANTINAPKDALRAVVQSTSNEDDRRTIMRHLHSCLSESASSKWRRVYVGLDLVQELLTNGNSQIVSETAAGMHFDLVQRLTFLGAFEYGFDKRVESMVRRKADSLRDCWLDRQLASDGDGEGSCVGKNDSVAVKSSVRSSGGGGAASLQTPPKQKKRNEFGLRGLVSVGHNDDTTDESSDDDSGSARGNRRGGRGSGTSSKQNTPRTSNAKKRIEDVSTAGETDSDSSTSSQTQRAAASVPKRPPPASDLLGGFDEPSAASGVSEPQVVLSSFDLLGGEGSPQQPTQTAQHGVTDANDFGDMFSNGPAAVASTRRAGSATLVSTSFDLI